MKRFEYMSYGKEMELIRLTDRIWVYPFEEERDRPNLCYIKGDRWSVAVDAGHSADHVRDFYNALEKEELQLPEITVLTHWHWDHSLGMHAVNGLCVANEKTNRHLKGFMERIRMEGTDFFLDMDETIRREYKDGKPVIISLADIVFSGEIQLDPGNCPLRIFQAESPHTDDSTLIEVIDEKVLILGDSISGVYPEWTVDPLLAGRLEETIRKADPEICLHGHLEPMSPDEMIRIMYGG